MVRLAGTPLIAIRKNRSLYIRYTDVKAVLIPLHPTYYLFDHKKLTVENLHSHSTICWVITSRMFEKAVMLGICWCILFMPVDNICIISAVSDSFEKILRYVCKSRSVGANRSSTFDDSEIKWSGGYLSGIRLAYPCIIPAVAILLAVRLLTLSSYTSVSSTISSAMISYRGLLICALFLSVADNKAYLDDI